jgi:hypothetical protein
MLELRIIREGAKNVVEIVKGDGANYKIIDKSPWVLFLQDGWFKEINKQGASRPRQILESRSSYERFWTSITSTE